MPLEILQREVSALGRHLVIIRHRRLGGTTCTHHIAELGAYERRVTRLPPGAYSCEPVLWTERDRASGMAHAQAVLGGYLAKDLQTDRYRRAVAARKQTLLAPADLVAEGQAQALGLAT